MDKLVQNQKGVFPKISHNDNISTFNSYFLFTTGSGKEAPYNQDYK